jgi:hypothetical protein
LSKEPVSDCTEKVNNTIVIITDRTFLAAVYVLVVSIKFYHVRARIKILGVGLTAEEKGYFEQFEDTRVFDADPTNTRNPCTRKGEAILLAEHDDSEYITLLDGDSILTGDITPYLSPGECLSTRIKTPEEDAALFTAHYEATEARGGIPRLVEDIWRIDVCDNTNSALSQTIASGNFTIHRKYFSFVRKWQNQMLKVLPNEFNKSAHTTGSFAYPQMDESVLESMLAFSADAPPLRRGLLDQDPDAYVAHLGPKPKHWLVLIPKKLKYFVPITRMVYYAHRNAYRVPPLPRTFEKVNAPLVFAGALAFFGVKALRTLGRKLAGPRRRFNSHMQKVSQKRT